MKNEKYLAIDIGGTKIEICKFDKNLSLISSRKYKTENYSTGKIEFLPEIENLIKKNLNKEIVSIGVSFNCVVKSGVIVYSSLLGGKVGVDIEEKFGKKFSLPIKVMNDVNAMALAESKFGKGRNIENFVLLNIGTGIRSSIILNGENVEGYMGNFGEISQKEIIIPEFNNEFVKYDDLLAGKGVSNIYKRISKKEESAKNIFKLFVEKDKYALKTIEIFVKYFVILLQDIAYFYNPEVIVLNGSLKKSFNYFIPSVIDVYRKKTLDMFCFREIVKSDIDYGACLGVVLEF